MSVTREHFVIPVALSNRHVHLCQTDLEKLFGPGYQLTVLRELAQAGQFAANEVVNLIGPKGTIEKVRVLGPLRPLTQVEIAPSDGYRLGIIPPVRDSGDLEGTPGIILEGSYGKVELSKGLILAARHIHMDTATAEQLGLKDKDYVDVEVEGERGLIFRHVLIRAAHNSVIQMHLDLDEGNAAGLKTGDTAKFWQP